MTRLRTPASGYRIVALLLALLFALPALAQSFPPLTGRVVDDAHLLAPAQAQAIDAKLAALEKDTGRQLVVATIPDLQGHEIEDYGYRLGRAWGIGSKAANDGALLIVAPAEKKVRIEVGYGLEPVLTDALSSVIIQTAILPSFRTGDMAGGIVAGTDAIVDQLRLPDDRARARVAQAAAVRPAAKGGSIAPLIFWGLIFLFVILPMLRGRRRGGLWPLLMWGPGLSSGGWGGGGFGGGGGGGGGGFSGGGGSFGGGGASGGW